MPVLSVTALARSWLQAPFRIPVAATVRLTIASGGGNHDWSITAGTSWASLDALCEAWTTALGGAAVVSIKADSEKHRGQVRVVTGTGASYTVTWSHSGDGTALRNRLGAAGNISTTASGATWSVYVLGSFYSWVGFSRVVRGRTGIAGGSYGRMMDGTLTSQHSRDASDDPVEMDVTLRWGIPPNGTRTMLGHVAIEGFLTDLYGAANTPADTFAFYHLATETPERWLVRLAADRIRLQPRAVPGSTPLGLFEMGLGLDVVEAPL